MKHHYSYLIIALLSLAASCSNDTSLRPESETEKMGRIVLAIDEGGIFMDVETRSADAPDITDYVFSISGETESGLILNQEPLEVNGGTAIIEAGTYIIYANNRAASIIGAGTGYYSGSGGVTLKAGETKNVTLAMGSPLNAKITVALDNTFSAKYEQPRITITDGTRSVTITDAATAAAATSGQSAYGLPTATYFEVPANSTLSYSITADAKSGTHVTDVVGVPGSITVASGRHTVITLTANSVSGEIIPIIDGDYEETFD
ncbi:MAG: DUF4493 domain-containing protein [Bacteroidaceae bacterium]|nr:DUF4493 domain-containing protein [Bacteroidaceae bacterium]